MKARKIEGLKKGKEEYRKMMEDMDNTVREWILTSSHIANSDVPEDYHMPMVERLKLVDYVLGKATVPAKRRLETGGGPSKVSKSVTPGSETGV